MFHGNFHVILIHTYKLKQYQTFLNKTGTWNNPCNTLSYKKKKKKINNYNKPSRLKWMNWIFCLILAFVKKKLSEILFQNGFIEISMSQSLKKPIPLLAPVCAVIHTSLTFALIMIIKRVWARIEMYSWVRPYVSRIPKSSCRLPFYQLSRIS